MHFLFLYYLLLIIAYTIYATYLSLSNKDLKDNSFVNLYILLLIFF